MKVNYNTYPILEFFDKNHLPKLNGKIYLHGEDRVVWEANPNATKTAQDTINEMYQGYIADRCGHNVYILMPKFQEAIAKGCNSIKTVARGTQLEKLFEDCCIIAGDMVYVCYRLTKDTYLGYTLNTEEHPNNYMVSIYYQGKIEDKKERHIVYLGTLAFSKDDDKAYRIELSLMSTWMGLYAVDYKDNEQLIDALLAVLIFKHYAKVELDIVHGHEKKMSTVAKEKIINETPKGVNIMDSDWYTTIYRTEGYDVRGHIRYYKKNDTISYVHPHRRKGYIRRAKILDDPTAEPDTTELVHKLDELKKRAT